MYRIIRFLSILFALIIAILAIWGISEFINSPYSGIQHQNLVIQYILEDSPNLEKGLKPGDRIVSIDGVRIRNINHLIYCVYKNRDRREQTYTIARTDSIFNVHIRYLPQPAYRIRLKFALTIVAFSFLIVGLVVIVKRFDILGVLFAIICFTFAFLIIEKPATPYPFFHIIGELIHDFLFIFLPAFFMHFFLIFPGREISEKSIRNKAIKYLYLPPTIFFLFSASFAMKRYFTTSSVGFIRQFESLIAIYWILYIVASISAFVRTYISSPGVQKVKFRIVIIGVALGILPISTVMLMKQFAPSMEIPFENLSVGFLSFISISFAYAILRHGAFDLSIVLRKVLVYTILSIFIISIYLLLSIAFGEKSEKLLGINTRIATVVILVALALLFSPIRSGTQRLVDSVFAKREKKYMDQILEFAKKMQFCVSTDEISKLVLEEISRIVEPVSAHFFIKADNLTYLHRMSLPEDKKIPFTSISNNSSIIRLMHTNRSCIMLDYFDSLWLKRNLDRMSREVILVSNISVALPLIEQDEILGFIFIGPKRNGKLYTYLDSEILELLAERTAIALKNIYLYKDSVEKEKLDKELRLAADIQKRLIPEFPPSLKNTQISGRIETSREVGGDFFDFIKFDDNEIAIGIADVSGKGIPAALLMTTLKAAFRSEAGKDKSPAAVVSSLNRILYDMSDETKFATFFYALYNDLTGILMYCNAGSYPPILVRADGSIDRLRKGGTIIGIDRNYNFSEGILKLKRGDIVVMFTDGIIDQENSDGVPFGEERLLVYIRDSLIHSADKMIDKLFAILFAYGNNKLKDDMSVVLLRRIG